MANTKKDSSQKQNSGNIEGNKNNKNQAKNTKSAPRKSDQNIKNSEKK